MFKSGYRERQLAAGNVHAAEFGAAVQLRKHLAGIEQALRVERAFHPLLRVQDRFPRTSAGIRSRFSTPTPCSPVSTPPTSTHSFRISAPNASGAFQFARLVGVVENQRMQIAVAGVKHVGDAQAVFLRHLASCARAPAAAWRAGWCRPCSNSPARCGRPPGTPPCGRPRTAAAAPPSVETSHETARHSLGDALDALDQMVDLGRRAVELDDQQRLDVERITGVDEFLGRVDRRLVHHLHAARDDAGADDARDAVAGVFRRREADQHRARGLRLLQDAHGDFGDDAEQPSEPVIRPSRS